MNGKIPFWSVLHALLIVVVIGGCGEKSSSKPVSASSSYGNGYAADDAEPVPVRGGTMLTNMPNWPENLRVYGTGSNTYLNSIIEGLCYESLCNIDPDTLDFQPGLAVKWTISEDKMKFTFELNPKAKWSDGKPVVAADVLATYRLIMDETLVDPMNRVAMDKLKEPVAKSDHLIEVECKEKDWRNFIAFSGLRILPAHEIGKMSGKEYLDKYNFAYTATSGPYIVDKNDIKENESLTITRRKDYWGDDEPQNKGLYNFDKIRFVVIRDDRLAFDKACKGELDFYVVYTAKWWVEDVEKLDAVKNGHLIRQKIYTKYPSGFQGEAYNMRRPPLDDIRVRKALAHLFNRKTMVEKFAYNEYDLLKSYFPDSDAENPDNKLVEFDPREAAKLLQEAGWKDRGSDGILVKDGKRLSFDVGYSSKGLEKYFTSWKEDCKQAGVELKLSLLTPETQWANTQERKFEIVSQAWGAVLFPYPRTMWHSKMADENGSNNIAGLKNEEVDKLIAQYDEEFDLVKRTELLRKIDGLIFNEHPYAMAWNLPCERVLYWNKFGKPKTVFRKYEDWRGAFAGWWVDPEKDKQLKQARKSGAAITPIPPVVLKPWAETATETVQR